MEKPQPRPTPEQALTCYQLCRMLTSYYRPVALVTNDPRIDRLYILAGEELEVLIYPNGDWRMIR
jgi:hypothetical protein